MNKKRTLITLSEKVGDPSQFIVDEKVGGVDYRYLVNGLESRGHDVHYVNWDNFTGNGFTKEYRHNDRKYVTPRDLDKNDLVFLYKMEHFLDPKNQGRFQYLLSGIENSGASTVNDINTIRWNLSKEHLYYLSKNGVNTIPTYELSNVSDKIASGTPMVVKPKIASRGDGLQLVNDDESRKWVSSLNGVSDQYVAQEYRPSIRNGERSLIFIGDEYSHAVLKLPNPNNPDEIRCNKSTGGTLSEYTPTKGEMDFSNNLIKIVSKDYPVHISRIDLVDVNGQPEVVEAELLNPSLFAGLIGKGEVVGEKLAEHFDKLVRL